MEEMQDIISPSIVEWTQDIVGKGLSLPPDIISEMWTPHHVEVEVGFISFIFNIIKFQVL